MIGDILQPTHLLFVLVVALLVLGPKRLPEVGRALGRGIRDFRSAISGDDIRDALSSSPSETPQPAAAEHPTPEVSQPLEASAEDSEHRRPSSAEPAAPASEPESSAQQAEPAKQNVA